MIFFHRFCVLFTGWVGLTKWNGLRLRRRSQICHSIIFSAWFCNLLGFLLMVLDDKLLDDVQFWYERSVVRVSAAFCNAPPCKTKNCSNFFRWINQSRINWMICPSSRGFVKGKRHLTGYSQVSGALDRAGCICGFIRLGATCLEFASKPSRGFGSGGPCVIHK